MTGPDMRLVCDEVVERLWPYLDDALPQTERARVANHLAGCDDCTSHFDFAQKFLDAVSAASKSAPEREALRGRVLEALAKEGFHRR